MQQQSKFLNQVVQACLRLLQQQQQRVLLQQQQHRHHVQLKVTKAFACETTATTTSSTIPRVPKNLWQLLYRSSTAATCETPIQMQKATQPPIPIPTPTRPSTTLRAQRATPTIMRNSFFGPTLFLPVITTTTAAATATTILASQKLASQQQQQHTRTFSCLSVAATPPFVVCPQPMAVANLAAAADEARSYSKFTAARDPAPFSGNVTPLSEDRASDLIANLKDSEREAIKLALAKYEALKQKEGFEGKLAATQWRTRFGRLTKVPALGDVDPTGTFCAFPDDWLKKKAAEKAIAPSNSDLVKIFFVNAVPFVAFGFLDNFTMIIAGDYIEQLFGTFMCISTMAAAGLGNTISDVLGIGSAYYVERGCEMLGLRPPDLTPVQMEMKSSRRSANYGRIIGITVGCLIGMLPLLFMEKKPKDPEDIAPACK